MFFFSKSTYLIHINSDQNPGSLLLHIGVITFFYTVDLHHTGPIPVANEVITPIARVITPVAHLFSAMYNRGFLHPI